MQGGASLRQQLEGNVREVIFGLEDSLVSTLGAITGIAAGTGDAFVVILSGIVLIFVEALSMTAGSYLSSKSAAEVMERRQKEDVSRALQERLDNDESLGDFLKKKKFTKKEIAVVFSVVKKERESWAREIARGEYHFMPSTGSSAVQAGIVMGVFYLSGGIFPLLPYFFFSVQDAVIPSVVLTGITLFFLGIFKARLAGTNWLKSGFEMTAVSLSAAVLGFLIGRVVADLFGISIA